VFAMVNCSLPESLEINATHVSLGTVHPYSLRAYAVRHFTSHLHERQR
jgi:hypothetical protein